METGELPFPNTDGYAPSIMTGSSDGLGVFSDLKVVNRDNYWSTAAPAARSETGALLGRTGLVGLWPQRSWGADLQDFLNIGESADVIWNAALSVHFTGRNRPANVIVGEASHLRFATSFPLQMLPFTEAIFSHLASTSLIFTWLSLLNPSAGPVDCTVGVYDADGALLGTKSMHLDPNHRYSQLLSEIFPDLGFRTAGYIRVLADEPIVGEEIFAGWGLNYYAIVPPCVVSPIPIEGAVKIVK